MKIIFIIALITLAYPLCTVCTPVPDVDDVIECKVEDDCLGHYTCLTPPGYCMTCAAWGPDDEDMPAKCKVTVPADNMDNGDVQFGQCQEETDCKLGFWCFESKCHDCEELKTSDREAYQLECAEWIKHLEELGDTGNHQNSTEHTTEGNDEPQTDTHDETMLGWTVGLSISTFTLLVGFVMYCYRKKFKRLWHRRGNGNRMNCWQKNVNRNGQAQQFHLVNEDDNAIPKQEAIVAEEDGEREQEDTLLPPENTEATIAALQPVDNGQIQSEFVPDQPKMMA